MNYMRNGSQRKRRMSRKRHEQLMRRRRIAKAAIAAVMLLLVVLVVAGTVFVIKAATAGSRAAGQTNVGASNSMPDNKGGNVPADVNLQTKSDPGQSETNASGGSQMQTGQGGETGQADTTKAQTGQTAQPKEPDSTTQAEPDATVPVQPDSTFTTSKGFKGYVKDGVTYIDGFLIVNKTYALPSDYIPQDTEVPVTSEWSTKSLNSELMEAYRQLSQAAADRGLNIYISSGYRSYNTQKNLYNNYVAKDGKALADTYSARAGHSEHQTGICFDLNTIDDSFQYTDEGIWVNDNAYKYGFIIRYPKGKEHITGYQYESWHLRYVGKEMAEKLYNNGNWITMEEYFGIDSKYAD